MATVREMHHVAINVRDLDAALHFYTEVLGLEEDVRATLRGSGITSLLDLQPDAEARQVFVRGPRSVGQVELIEWSQPGEKVDRRITDLGFSLISFGVSPDDFDALLERCREHGVTVLAGPEILDIPEYDATRLLIVADPEGNPVEFMCPAHTPAERENSG